MREPVRDRERLEHILEAIDNLLAFTAGKTAEQLTTDRILFYAVVKNIEIIGEAAYKLTKVFLKEHPETPWSDIIKMRHILIHDYYQIDEKAVLYVIEDNLRPLRDQVLRYLNETDWDEWAKNEEVIVESVVHKSLMQTARRMKSKGYEIQEIVSITGLTDEEIDSL